ncbi:tetratricopeptide repeat protein [Stenotrophomonas acidaminiphila]|uniref:tetratricopeptide repeat protein n=1 Tax=Stenotrophomonas acidaminiphila TaxID=128780 RepID=UPI0028A81BE8|nr:tetratricopeptide repeat protein [Stenotrophomonas acidaminiphila]
MSLIHDALRQPATATDSGAPSPTHASPRRLPDGSRFPVVWLLAGAVVAVPAVFLIPRDPTPPDPSATPAITTVMPVAAVIPPAAAPLLPAASIDSIDSATTRPADPTAPTPAAAPRVATHAAPPAASMAPDNAPADPSPAAHVADNGSAPPARAQIQLSVRRQDPAGAKRDAGDESTTVAVRMAMNALNTAVAGGNEVGINDALTRLQALLPPQSLTLLRARAWVAHGGGDYAGAERLYRAILDRVPDDETAGVNLALLDARRGNVAEARTRLGQLASRNGRSTRVAQALAELEAAQQ